MRKGEVIRTVIISSTISAQGVAVNPHDPGSPAGKPDMHGMVCVDTGGGNIACGKPVMRNRPG